jgi:hypothetical protein
MEDIYVRAIPGGAGKYYYSYDVFWRGRQIVARSHNPECEAARVLAAGGFNGWAVLRDLETGKGRLRFNVRALKGLSFWEDDRGMGFRKFEKMPVVPKWVR